MRKKHWILFLFLAAIATVFVSSCAKDDPDPTNPYSKINRTTTTAGDTTDPRSFAGLHKRIFSVHCAVPGCHDGNFEPDFRSVQSAYSTLVYAPVIKKLKPWKYRVSPYDTGMSWIWQRLNHDIVVSGSDTSQGRMPLYSSQLSLTDRNNICYWILHGAKDMFNQPPAIPNSEPTVTGYIALNAAYTYRFDTIRIGNIYYNSFLVDTSTVINIAVGAIDDSTDASMLINNKLKLSTSMDDFSSAKVLNGTYVSGTGYKLWVFTFNTNLFKANDVVYMRYYTNDGNHSTDTEFPRTDLIYPYKTYWSFKVVAK